MKIVLLTASGERNLGDELILSQEISLLRELYPDSLLYIYSHNVGYTKNFLIHAGHDILSLHFCEYFPNNIRKKPLRNIRNFFCFIKHISQSNYIVIGGGGLLYESDQESGGGLSPTYLWSLRIRLAKFFGKKVRMFALGISLKRATLEKYKSILLYPEWSVRDKKSQKLLKEVGISSILLDDPVNLHKPVCIKSETKTCGLALRKGFLSENQLHIIISTLREQGYEPIGLPHSMHPNVDEACDHAYLSSIAHAHGFNVYNSIEEVYDCYKSIDVIVAMRLHSMILSRSFNIPMFAISYSQKTDEYMSMYNLHGVYSTDREDYDYSKIEMKISDTVFDSDESKKRMGDFLTE